MTTCASALDVDDDVLAGDLGGDVDDRLDLADRARFEHDVAEAHGVQLVDQLDGFLEIGNARADHNAVDGSTGLASLLHQPLAADLKLPQIGIQEQRVELHRAARLEQVGELGDAVGEDLLGDLTATGQLGPVAGVGGRGDDLGVDGRGRHTRQQDRRASGQAGELGGQLHGAVGQLDRGRREAGPRGSTSGSAPTVNRLR